MQHNGGTGQGQESWSLDLALDLGGALEKFRANLQHLARGVGIQGCSGFSSGFGVGANTLGSACGSASRENALLSIVRPNRVVSVVAQSNQLVLLWR